MRSFCEFLFIIFVVRLFVPLRPSIFLSELIDCRSISFSSFILLNKILGQSDRSRLTLSLSSLIDRHLVRFSIVYK